MRFRTLLLSLLLLLPFAALHAAQAEMTPTEAAADSIAQTDHTAYTLPPAELAKATTLGTTRTVLHFAEALWSILTLWLILEWRIAARMRNLATNLSKNRWAQCFLFFFQFLLLTSLLEPAVRSVSPPCLGHSIWAQRPVSWGFLVWLIS